MTQNQQEHILDRFREGSCKLMIATTVAEEGLDISACNLIINYNYSTNDIGHIQRMGKQFRNYPLFTPRQRGVL